MEIKGYEKEYTISELGDVYSLVRKTAMAQTKDFDGYLRVGLYKDKKQKKFLVHRLVAAAFIPNPDKKPQVNHINGIKTDNRVSNLEWCSRSENQQHRYNVLGHVNPDRSLTKEQVFEILETKGEVGRLALKFGVSKACIKKVREGRNYKNYNRDFKHQLFLNNKQ